METVWSSLVNRRSSWKILQLTAQLHNVYFLLQTKTTHVDSEMINITKFDIVTLCATLSEENNVFENNIYLHFVYTIEVFLKQLVTGHPVYCINQSEESITWALVASSRLRLIRVVLTVWYSWLLSNGFLSSQDKRCLTESRTSATEAMIGARTTCFSPTWWKC